MVTDNYGASTTIGIQAHLSPILSPPHIPTSCPHLMSPPPHVLNSCPHLKSTPHVSIDPVGQVLVMDQRCKEILR